MLYSGGATCYPSPGAPPPANFHQRTRSVRGPSRPEAPNEPPVDFADFHRPPDSSLHPASGSPDIPRRPRPHQPPCQPHGVIASTPQAIHRYSTPTEPGTNTIPPTTRPARRLTPFSNLSRCCSSPLHPAARSPPSHTLRLATQNICDVVGRGRGSPGWSEAERRGPPSSMPGAEPNPACERAAGCPAGVFAL